MNRSTCLERNFRQMKMGRQKSLNHFPGFPRDQARARVQQRQRKNGLIFREFPGRAPSPRLHCICQAARCRGTNRIANPGCSQRHSSLKAQKIHILQPSKPRRSCQHRVAIHFYYDIRPKFLAHRRQRTQDALNSGNTIQVPLTVKSRDYAETLPRQRHGSVCLVHRADKQRIGRKSAHSGSPEVNQIRITGASECNKSYFHGRSTMKDR